MYSRIQLAFISAILSIGMSTNAWGQANTLNTQQRDNFISNLNRIQYSVAKIQKAENKAIAEDEYSSIISRISLEGINDKRLIDEYSDLLNTCSELQLSENEKKFLKQLNEKQQKEAYKKAFSNIGSVFVPGRSPAQTVASLIYTSISSSFAIAEAKSQLSTQLEKDMFYLNQANLKTINAKRTQLFTTSASLLNGNSSQGLISENSMNVFIDAVLTNDHSQRQARLNESELKKNMEKFPPYWFELGDAYQKNNDITNAKACYAKFEQLKKNDIVRNDPDYIRLIQNMVQILLGKDPSKARQNAIANKSVILRYIELYKQNSLDSEAGEKNLFLAKLYYLVGDLGSSRECLNYVIKSKSNPEYIDRAIDLKSLIGASEGELSHIYQDAFNFNNIVFGDAADEMKALGLDKGVKETISSYTKEIKDKGFFSTIGDHFFAENIVSKDKFHFVIPSSLSNDYEIKIKIDGAEYRDTLLAIPGQKSHACFVALDNSDLKKHESIEISFTSKSRTITIAFAINPVDNKVFDSASKAYSRIGTDIMSVNAQKAVQFGEQTRKYKYEVDDVESLRKDIRKEKEKAGKTKSKETINGEVTIALRERLAPDMRNIQDISNDVDMSFQKRETILFSPSFITYGGSKYLIGIQSVYDSLVKHKAVFTSDGDFKNVY